MPHVRLLPRPEASDAARVIAKAFESDPLFTHLFPKAGSRQRRTAVFYANTIRRLYLPHGIAEVAQREASGEIEAVALWRTPGGSAKAAERACLSALRRASGLPQFAHVLRTFDAFDRVYPTGDFYYLSILATSPEAQGAGLGSALLRSGLAWADRDGVGAYLETGTAANVAFYRSHGFRVLHPIPLPDGGPTHWGLWRDPASGDA